MFLSDPEKAEASHEAIRPSRILQELGGQTE
jgi:hypothetical protein